MRPALIVLVLLGLSGVSCPASAAPLDRGQATAQTPSPRPAPEADEDGPARTGASGGPQQASRPGERRRITYASCNRESHKRNLRGGARRRFLIRCKLGFERRPPPAPRPAEPAPPGKRP